MRIVCSIMFAAALAMLAHAALADTISDAALARIIPGHSTRADIETLLGAPWRVTQFDDCGQAMAGQADETWEYRGRDPDGAYRLHIEFDEHGVVHLISEIPDKTGEARAIVITTPALCLSM